jgi:hypothetical protein
MGRTGDENVKSYTTEVEAIQITDANLGELVELSVEWPEVIVKCQSPDGGTTITNRVHSVEIKDRDGIGQPGDWLISAGFAEFVIVNATDFARDYKPAK